MNPKIKKFLFLAVFLLIAALPLRAVSADVGPKPTMEFAFEGLGGLAIESGILYECDQPACGDAKPLEELGPQRLTCDAQSCRALAYGFAQYHKLEIKFSDGTTRSSNVFETAGFNSLYTVAVRENDLQVEARFNFAEPANLFYALCACACLGLVLVAGLVVFIVKRAKKR